MQKRLPFQDEEGCHIRPYLRWSVGEHYGLAAKGIQEDAFCQAEIMHGSVDCMAQECVLDHLTMASMYAVQMLRLAYCYLVPQTAFIVETKACVNSEQAYYDYILNGPPSRCLRLAYSATSLEYVDLCSKKFECVEKRDSYPCNVTELKYFLQT